MGSYTFRWEQPAEEVFVTGAFDNWSKSVKLDKKDVVHEKTVAISDVSQAIAYKFFVDGVWVHDPTKKLERDHEGNLNNVVYPEEIGPPNSMASQTISSVAPEATTTELAGAQPLENKSEQQQDVPGTFPETPAAEHEEKGEESNKGLIAGAAAAGAGVAAAVGGTIAALTGRSDKKVEEEQTFSAQPIPASGGIGNPVHLEPGEKVPDSSTVTGNTLTSNVKLDQASYEKSDAAVSQIPPVGSSQAASDDVTGLGKPTASMIPESSMGMGSDAPAPLEGAAISSVGVASTTNQLAGQQPLEPRGVPEVVADSQKQAHVAPEASANPTAVEEKKEMESELKSKVPEEQSGSDNKTGIYAAVAGGVAAAGAAITGAAVAAREKTHEATGTDPVSLLPTSVQQSIDGMNKQSEAATAVPEEVKESQKEAHAAPEASANAEAVKEKSQAEQELLQKVPESQASGEPAPTATAATTAVAPTTSASGAPQLADPVGAGLAPISMDEKPARSSGLNAPAGAPAVPSTAQAAATAAVANTASPPPAASPVQNSRDVSPMSRPIAGGLMDGGQQPSVTTGTDSGATASKSTPASNKRHSFGGFMKNHPDTPPTTGTDGKKKKKGFLSKLKEKLKN